MKAHFIGLCGKGMSAVATLLQEKGWIVGGSDEGVYPPVSTYLEEHSIPCIDGYSASNIPKDADVIVIGKNAKLVAETNEEVAAAFASGKPIRSFPETLNELTADTFNYVITGSFAKSTCTALTSWILTHAAKDPSYFIGAIPLDLPDVAHLGAGNSFVLEGDEYPAANWDQNSKFLYYNARTILLTSCEHDHVNVFPTIESYLEPFIQLLLQLPPDGLLVACLDGENVETVLEKTGKRAVTYSLSNHQADWWAQNITHGTITAFDVIFRGTKIMRLETQLLGDHNVQNILGVAALLLSNDAVLPYQVAAAVKAFRGVKSRLELKTHNTTVPVYEDYGSSRAKALAGLSTIRKTFPNRRMIVLFEPHTFSFRNRAAIHWYNDLFNAADTVFVYQPPALGSATHDQLTQQEIAEAIQATGKTVYQPKSKEEILDQLKSIVQADDVILIETSGDLGGAIEPVVDLITAGFPDSQ